MIWGGHQQAEAEMVIVSYSKRKTLLLSSVDILVRCTVCSKLRRSTDRSMQHWHLVQKDNPMAQNVKEAAIKANAEYEVWDRQMDVGNVSVGLGISSIHSIRTSKEIIDELRLEALDALEYLPLFIIGIFYRYRV